jgi:hypothetical protein
MRHLRRMATALSLMVLAVNVAIWAWPDETGKSPLVATPG